MIALTPLAFVSQTPPEAEALLAKMRAAYQAVKSAKFTVQFEAADSTGPTVTGSVNYEYMSPSKLRAEFTVPPQAPFRLICNGKAIAIFTSAGKRREFSFSFKTLSANLPTNLETICFYDAEHELSVGKGGNMAHSKLQVLTSVPWNDKKWTVLRETDSAEDITVDYFIDPASSLIYRTLGSEISSKKTYIDARVIALQLNPTIDPSRFDL